MDYEKLQRLYDLRSLKEKVTEVNMQHGSAFSIRLAKASREQLSALQEEIDELENDPDIKGGIDDLRDQFRKG